MRSVVKGLRIPVQRIRYANRSGQAARRLEHHFVGNRRPEDGSRGRRRCHDCDRRDVVHLRRDGRHVRRHHESGRDEEAEDLRLARDRRACGGHAPPWYLQARWQELDDLSGGERQEETREVRDHGRHGLDARNPRTRECGTQDDQSEAGRQPGERRRCRSLRLAWCHALAQGRLRESRPPAQRPHWKANGPWSPPCSTAP